MSGKQQKRLRKQKEQQEAKTLGQDDRGQFSFEHAADWTTSMQMLVPLNILSLYERGGITWRDVFLAYLSGEVAGVEMDAASTTIGSGRSLNAAAHAFAMLSYLPGGVPLVGERYDAESILAGCVGEERAQTHVQAARAAAFAVPVSRAPLSELARRCLPLPGVPPSDPLPLAFLTHDGLPPGAESLARALIAHLAIEALFMNRKLRNALNDSDSLHSIDVAPVPKSPDETLRTVLEEASRLRPCEQDRDLVDALTRSSEKWVRFFLHCSRSLHEAGNRSPERIDALFSFARSSSAMDRALLQHLTILIADSQFSHLRDKLPRISAYASLVSVLECLLT